MKGAPMDPPRLRDQHDQANLAERMAGQAARDLAEPEPLSEIALARIAARLQGQSPRRRPLWLGWAVVTGAFLLGVVTAASAARLDLVPRWLTSFVRGAPAPAARPGPAKARARAGERTPGPSAALPAEGPPALEVSPAPAPAAAFPAIAPAVAPTSAVPTALVARPTPPDSRASSTLAPPSSARTPRPVDGRRPVSGPKGTAVAMLAEPPAARAPRPDGHEAALATSPPRPTGLTLPGAAADWPPPPVAVPQARSASSIPQPPLTPAASPSVRPAPAEPTMAPSSRPQRSAAHLKQVVRALRVERSPAAALVLLDRHAGELAADAFAEEALLLRVEAMLALGQRSQVLRLLDGLSLAEVAASRALLVTRGELRAAANRCAEGIADFDLVLAEARRPPKQALLGRARCKQKLGDAAGAQADLDRYRREFPGGAIR